MQLFVAVVVNVVIAVVVIAVVVVIMEVYDRELTRWRVMINNMIQYVTASGTSLSRFYLNYKKLNLTRSSKRPQIKPSVGCY
jgi:hypothetical protein